MSQVLGLGLGLESQVLGLGLGLEAQVLGLGLGLETQVLGLGLGLEPQVLVNITAISYRQRSPVVINRPHTVQGTFNKRRVL